MNRIEFMEELSGLLQDIPEEDRMDALNYYNDYFDDAGAENEKNVIDELKASVEEIKASIDNGERPVFDSIDALFDELDK